MRPVGAVYQAWVPDVLPDSRQKVSVRDKMTSKPKSRTDCKNQVQRRLKTPHGLKNIMSRL